jgi:hypothetical protein
MCVWVWVWVRVCGHTHAYLHKHDRQRAAMKSCTHASLNGCMHSYIHAVDRSAYLHVRMPCSANRGMRAACMCVCSSMRVTRSDVCVCAYASARLRMRACTEHAGVVPARAMVFMHARRACPECIMHHEGIMHYAFMHAFMHARTHDRPQAKLAQANVTYMSYARHPHMHAYTAVDRMHKGINTACLRPG